MISTDCSSIAKLDAVKPRYNEAAARKRKPLMPPHAPCCCDFFFCTKMKHKETGKPPEGTADSSQSLVDQRPLKG